MPVHRLLVVIVLEFYVIHLALISFNPFHSLVCSRALAASAMQKPKNVLVFGGNGFIGGTVVRYLLDQNMPENQLKPEKAKDPNGQKMGSGILESTGNPKFKLWLLNRGSWNWDTGETIKPHPDVTSVFCDRSDPETCLDGLARDERLKGIVFDAVLDFSAYQPADVEPFYDWIREAVQGPYVYISTDSVYEVCDPAIVSSPIREEMAAVQGPYVYISTDSVYEVCDPAIVSSPIREEMAVRPIDPPKMKLAAKKDSYGHRKLEVEEFLVKQAKSTGLPNIFLRLPDVLGPRDSTGRWWEYQMWLEYANQEYAVPVPLNFRYLSTSYVYVRDIAKVVDTILSMDSTHRIKIYNEAFNLGLEQPKTLAEFLKGLGNALNLKNVNLAMDASGSYGFPSVTQGALNIDKARKALGFEPTDWETTLSETARWYRETGYEKYPKDREATFEELIEDLKILNDDEKVMEMVRKRFRSAVNEQKKEEL